MPEITDKDILKAAEAMWAVGYTDKLSDQSDSVRDEYLTMAEAALRSFS